MNNQGVIINGDSDADFQMLLKEGRIINPELCNKYRKILKNLNEEIKTSDLDLIVNSLFASFYNMAVQELDDVVMNKDVKLSKDKRTRVMGLLSKGKRVGEEGELASLFKQKIVDGYRVRIVKPGYSLEKLRFELGTIGNCWINKDTMNYKENEIKVTWHIKDINAGGCVLFINEKPSSDSKSYEPVVQNRSYVAITKANEPILFIDTIENGDTGCSHISTWVEKARGREFLYSVAAPIYVAKSYGIEKIALGECETVELGSLLGFKEETIFNSSSRYEDYYARKIGIQGHSEGNKGPYVYQLVKSTERRIIKLSNITSSKDGLLKRLTDVTGFLEDNEKIRKNEHKMEEVKLYLNCIELVNESSGIASKEVYYGIFKLRESYFT